MTDYLAAEEKSIKAQAQAASLNWLVPSAVISQTQRAASSCFWKARESPFLLRFVPFREKLFKPMISSLLRCKR
jgi:hypothetical protein